MPEPITKTQRWLDLIAFLIGRRLPVSVEQIMEGVPAYAAKWEAGDDTDRAVRRASVRRTFERDKDELRELGIPLETVSFSIHHGEEYQEGYRLARKDFYLPYLKIVSEAEGIPGPSIRTKRRESPQEPPQRGTPRRGVADLSLTPPEAGAALDAFYRASDLPSFPYASEARSAFRKLSGDFDLEGFRPPPILHADRPEAESVRASMRTLSGALDARKRVTFIYHGIHRDEDTERDVAPYGLAFQGGHWYLVGHDALRDGMRVFRVSRMGDPSPNRSKPHTPDYEIPSDFRVSELLGREAWELGSADEGEVEAHVHFRFPVSLWAARNRHGMLKAEQPDGSAVRAFNVRQVNPFLRWLLTFEGDAELLSPPDLRTQLRELARDVAAIYAEDSDDSGGSGSDG
jgi:proteasome accessory factor B